MKMKTTLFSHLQSFKKSYSVSKQLPVPDKKFNVNTKRGVANILRAGATWLESHQWGKHGLKREVRGNTNYCAIGACSMAVYGKPTYFGGKLAGDIQGTLIAFNDHEASNKRDVISKLRNTARDLEHGGNL